MSTLTITTIQADLQWEDKTANLRRLEEMISGIDQPTELVILPEMFSTGFSMRPAALAEKMDGPTIGWMKALAARKKIILTGSVIIEEEGHYFNRLIWMLPNGQYGYYDKRHRFAYAGEDKQYTAGHKRLIASVKGWKALPLVCYDLRFPVWSRQTPAAATLAAATPAAGASSAEASAKAAASSAEASAKAAATPSAATLAAGIPHTILPADNSNYGEFAAIKSAAPTGTPPPATRGTVPEYDLIIYVANWPERRSHAWKTLLQARAIENQAYVIGVNRVGADGNQIAHSGDSLIIDPLGEVLYHGAAKEDVKTLTLQKTRLEEIRERYPFWKDADHFQIEP